jgi:hypothetical protein
MGEINVVTATSLARARQLAKQLKLTNIREMSDLFGVEPDTRSQSARDEAFQKIISNTAFLKGYRDHQNVPITIIGVMINWDHRRTHRLAPESLAFMANQFWTERFRGADRITFVQLKHRGSASGAEMELSSFYKRKEKFLRILRNLQDMFRKIRR